MYQEYFGGAALPTDVCVLRFAGATLDGTSLGRCSPPFITLATMDPELERRVLLHELTHMFLYLRGDPHAMGHGQTFMVEIARLQKLGCGICMPDSQIAG